MLFIADDEGGGMPWTGGGRRASFCGAMNSTCPPTSPSVTAAWYGEKKIYILGVCVQQNTQGLRKEEKEIEEEEESKEKKRKKRKNKRGYTVQYRKYAHSLSQINYKYTIQTAIREAKKNQPYLSKKSP